MDNTLSQSRDLKQSLQTIIDMAEPPQLVQWMHDRIPTLPSVSGDTVFWGELLNACEHSWRLEQIPIAVQLTSQSNAIPTLAWKWTLWLFITTTVNEIKGFSLCGVQYFLATSIKQWWLKTSRATLWLVGHSEFGQCAKWMECFDEPPQRKKHSHLSGIGLNNTNKNEWLCWSISVSNERVDHVLSY